MNDFYTDILTGAMFFNRLNWLYFRRIRHLISAIRNSVHSQ